MLLTNSVDDKIIATNNNELCLRLLEFLQKQFDVEDVGMTHWYLQVVLNQSQCAALIVSRFLPQHSNTNITKEDKTKHESPLPATFVPTKKDFATNLLELQQLEQTYYGSTLQLLEC